MAEERSRLKIRDDGLREALTDFRGYVAFVELTSVSTPRSGTVTSVTRSFPHGTAGTLHVRGLGSDLYRLGVPDKVIQAILRHSNVNITLGYYVKTVSPDVLAAMGKFEEKLTAPRPSGHR